MSIVQIEIIGDLICPWCPIGYRRLLKAITEFGSDLTFEFRWSPYELAPDLPDEGVDLSEAAASGHGTTPDDMDRQHEEVCKIGRALGFEGMSYVRGMRLSRTLNAHQLVMWVGQEKSYEKQTQMVLAFQNMFFVLHQDFGNQTHLLDAVETIGLDRNEAEAVLREERYAAAVKAFQTQTKAELVNGVPAFRVNGELCPNITGPKPHEIWRPVFERLRGDSS